MLDLHQTEGALRIRAAPGGCSDTKTACGAGPLPAEEKGSLLRTARRHVGDGHPREAKDAPGRPSLGHIPPNARHRRGSQCCKSSPPPPAHWHKRPCAEFTADRVQQIITTDNICPPSPLSVGFELMIRHPLLYPVISFERPMILAVENSAVGLDREQSMPENIDSYL